MAVRRFQPRIARHLIRVPFIDFTSLTSTLFRVEEDIARGLQLDSSTTDPKGKKPSVEQSHDVYIVFSLRQRIARRTRATSRSTEEYSPYPQHHHT